ncbi:MAG: carboxypeptidase regulatory-like domain-containing protein [Candidatus Hydrogenedentes bacterium]|nr:carboxypeptidase regulatory-like domain-containing protein [Candidatus Hydrogenedentota bacterium]
MKARFIIVALIVLVLCGAVAYTLLSRPNAHRPEGGSESAGSTPARLENPFQRPALTRPTESAPTLSKAEHSPIKGEGAIRGLVLLPDGTPARGASVQVQSDDPAATKEGHTNHADQDGQFALNQLAWGWYGVYASQDERAATAVCLLSPHKPAAEVTLVLEPAGFISGHVIGDAGAGVAAASIAPVMKDDRRLQPGQRAAMTIQTGADGSFTSPLLPERTWQFEVRADGYATTITPPINVGTSGARVYLERGGILSGVVVDVESGNPVTGMKLRAAKPDVPADAHEAKTGSAGEFAFAHLVNGVNRVASSDSDRVLVPAFSTVDVGAGGMSEDLVLHAGKAAIVAGKILDVAGAPVPGLTVYADAQDTSATLPGHSDPSGQEGEYRITGLAPGTYVLSVPQLGHLQIQTQTVTLEQGESRAGVDFTLPFGISASGHVYDTAGSPVPGAEIEGKYFAGPFGQGRVTATADASGTFQVYGPQPESELHLRAVTGNASSPWYGPIIVSAEGVQDLELILSEVRDSAIAGIVVSETGQPLRCILRVDDPATAVSGAPVQQIITGWDGTFMVPVHTPGDYEIYLGAYEPEGFMNATTLAARLSLAAGQSERGLRLVYTENGQFVIAGHVLDAGGNPVPGAMITPAVSADSAGGPLPSAQSDAQGSFSLDMPDEGTYRLVVMAPGYSVQHMHDVATGTVDVEVVLEKKAQLQGRVVDATTGQAVPAFSVAIVREGLPSDRVLRLQPVHDSQGSFTIDIPSVPDSIFEVFVKADGYQESRTPLDPSKHMPGSPSLLIPVSPLR